VGGQRASGVYGDRVEVPRATGLSTRRLREHDASTSGGDRRLSLLPAVQRRHLRLDLQPDHPPSTDHSFNTYLSSDPASASSSSRPDVWRCRTVHAEDEERRIGARSRQAHRPRCTSSVAGIQSRRRRTRPTACRRCRRSRASTPRSTRTSTASCRAPSHRTDDDCSASTSTSSRLTYRYAVDATTETNIHTFIRRPTTLHKLENSSTPIDVTPTPTTHFMTACYLNS